MQTKSKQKRRNKTLELKEEKKENMGKNKLTTLVSVIKKKEEN